MTWRNFIYKEIKMSKNEFENAIILTDENGVETPFEFLDMVEYKGEEYVILIPVDDEEGEVYILRAEPGENPDNFDEEMYFSVDDDDILDAVFEIFKERNDEEFNFTE